MATDPGFLASLIGTDVDERAVFEAQRREAYKSGRGTNIDYAAGQQASPLLRGVLSGIGGLLSGKAPNAEKGGRSFSGFGQNFAEGMQTREDELIAQANGISPNELRSRRAIRKELATTDIKDDGSYDARIKLAGKAAKIAQANGDFAGMARALSQIDFLRKEEIAFQQLQDKESRTKEQFGRESVQDVWIDGQKTTGQQGVGPDGKTRGVWTTDPTTGQPVFKPVGTYFLKDVTGGTGAGYQGIEKFALQIANKSDWDKTRKQIVAGRDHTRKVRRVFDQLSELKKSGLVESVQGGSGTVLAGVDNFVKNLKGVVKPFLTGGAGADNEGRYYVDRNGNARGIRAWMNAAVGDENHGLWNALELPENVKKASHEAQIYRAQIMELAYMAARLAEPSNRGLSDNDVQNALIRIAGGTSDMGVILERFMEMQYDAAYSLEDSLDSYEEAFTNAGYTSEEFESYLGGEALRNYRNDLDDLASYTSAVVNPKSGAVTFGEEGTVDPETGLTDEQILGL